MAMIRDLGGVSLYDLDRYRLLSQPRTAPAPAPAPIAIWPAPAPVMSMPAPELVDPYRLLGAEQTPPPAPTTTPELGGVALTDLARTAPAPPPPAPSPTSSTGTRTPTEAPPPPAPRAPADIGGVPVTDLPRTAPAPAPTAPTAPSTPTAPTGTTQAPLMQEEGGGAPTRPPAPSPSPTQSPRTTPAPPPPRSTTPPTTGRPGTTPATPTTPETPYPTGYYEPPVATAPPGTPAGYQPGAVPQMPPQKAPSGVTYTYENGNWVPEKDAFFYWWARVHPDVRGPPTESLQKEYAQAVAGDQIWLERAREDWQAQQLKDVRTSPETQARTGQLQEQGRRELYGRAFKEAEKYGEAMSSRGFGLSPVAGMVQGDIMQSAAEAKADADLAALNQAIAEGQNLIFGGEALRKPTTAALLQDALDARAFERRAALERELAPSDFEQFLGSLAGIGGSAALKYLGGFRLPGGGGRDEYDWEWDPNRVPVEW